MDSSKPPEPAAEQDDVNALEPTAAADSSASDSGAESLETTDAPGADGVIDATSSDSGANKQPEVSAPKKGGIKDKLRRFNIYLLMFVLILVIGAGILMVAYFQSKKVNTTNAINTTDLTAEALREIAESDATVGSTQQVLNVQSSAVFAGKVLVRDGLEVATTLRVGGTTALADLTVSGTSQFGQVQIDRNLAVSGDTAVQGNLTARGLQISGGGNFSGPVSAPQITTTNLQLNGDLVLTHHIVAGGPTPTLSQGPALGGGGSASVSGSDTSGTVNINVGSGAGAGCFATINFRTRYNSTPHVSLTPVGSAGGTIDYYVTRTATSFSICDATAPPAGASFGFDYFVVN